MRSIKKNKSRVYIAEKRDYLDCLKYLGQRPLKLIANSFYPNESEWKETHWSFKSNRHKVKDKKVLTNPKDTFQFSIANEFSKQDYHIHKSTLEIYISDFQMELESGEEEKFICKKGILIVPPGTRHRIKLFGTTYVLQVMQKKLPINSDKEIIKG
jgi:quercetin dioxygenase-like cupin family protein